MSKGRIFLAISTTIMALVMALVIFSNAIPTPALASANISTADTLTTKSVYTFAKESTADKIVAFGKSLIGTRYHYTGKSRATGFDCSGFTHYVFGQFGIELSPASKEQIFAGERVSLAEVRKGDLLVFTGTKPAVRQPGHVGIVITEHGEKPVRFVHSSSNGGVKISQVDSTAYAVRLLQVRRLLN